MLRTRQLSSLKREEIAEWKSGLYIGLSLFLHEVFAAFESELMVDFAGFLLNTQLVDKTRQADNQYIGHITTLMRHLCKRVLEHSH